MSRYRSTTPAGGLTTHFGAVRSAEMCDGAAAALAATMTSGPKRSSTSRRVIIQRIPANVPMPPMLPVAWPQSDCSPPISALQRRAWRPRSQDVHTITPMGSDRGVLPSLELPVDAAPIFMSRPARSACLSWRAGRELWNFALCPASDREPGVTGDVAGKFDRVCTIAHDKKI